jgi:hypothetical protein
MVAGVKPLEVTFLVFIDLNDYYELTKSKPICLTLFAFVCSNNQSCIEALNISAKTLYCFVRYYYLLLSTFLTEKSVYTIDELTLSMNSFFQDLDRTPTNLPTTIIQEDVETIISDHKGLIIGVIVITIIIVICLICLVVLRKRCCRRQRDVETALAGRDTTAVTETGHTEAGDNVPNNDDHSTEEV